MKIEIGKKYKLSQEYFESLVIKPKTDLVKITAIANNTVTFSDGKSNFISQMNNFVNNIESITTTRMSMPRPIIPAIPPTEPDIPTEPTEPIEPPTEPIEPPVEPTEPPPTEPENPYGNDYI